MAGQIEGSRAVAKAVASCRPDLISGCQGTVPASIMAALADRARRGALARYGIAAGLGVRQWWEGGIYENTYKKGADGKWRAIDGRPIGEYSFASRRLISRSASSAIRRIGRSGWSRGTRSSGLR